MREMSVLRDKLKKKIAKAEQEQFIIKGDSKAERFYEGYLQALNFVEALLVETEKTHLLIERKKLQDRFIEVIDNLVEHDVCCVHCLEKGQAMELKKLLGDEK